MMTREPTTTRTAAVMAANPTDGAAGKSSSWPGGEPQEVRDAYDAKQGARK